MESEGPTIVDLFCGAGGLSEGFRQAGFKVLLGVDSDPWSAKTYRTNHGKCLEEKIENVTASMIYHTAGTRNVTVLAAGPPCQAFSTVGVAKLKDLGKSTTFRNPINRLYKEFLRLVKEVEPPFFVMENVGRMFSIYDGRIKKEIESELEGKYQVTFYYENVADFGVPQCRKRGIAIGNRLKVGNPVLAHTHFDPEKRSPGSGLQPYETIRSAISDLPKIKAGGGRIKMKYRGHNLSRYQIKRREGADDFVYDHVARRHNTKDLRIFKLLKQGQWIKDLPKRYNRYRDDIFLDKYRKQSWNRTSSTILAHLAKDGLMFIHPDGTQNRSFSPREAARIQSFDDRYVFEGPRTKQFIQIGNAVPPQFSKAIASAILASMIREIPLAIVSK